MVTDELMPGAMVGEYRVERAIGEGSFGKVYAAVQAMIGKKAAIKVLGFEHAANRQFVSRFVEEARAVNKIRHRNIVDIFSFGQLPDGRHYLIMELLEGEPMSAFLQRRGRIPVAEALPILRQVARALEAAHKEGIAHRDLKPDNLFLTYDEDGAVFPKLLDFGIAKLMGESPMGHKTQTGTPMGTPLYMSPEQCKGSHIDHRTDIYSFGVLVFEMLTGFRPFDSENVLDILMSHLARPAPTMSSFEPSLPPALDPPVARMLEKEPDRRPPSVLIAIEALIAAANAAGLAVPSSRDGMGASFIGSAPNVRSNTVPQAPAQSGYPAAPSGSYAAPAASAGYPAAPQLPPQTHQQPPHLPMTQRSPEPGYPRVPTAAMGPHYGAPGPVAPLATGATGDASLKPVGATLTTPRPPSRAGFYVAGALIAVLAIGGGFLLLRKRDKDESASSDRDRGGKNDRRRTKRNAKADPKDPDDDDDDDDDGSAATFGDVVPNVGHARHSNETSSFAFTMNSAGTSRNMATTSTILGDFRVTAADGAGVTKAEASFTTAEESTSVDHGLPEKKPSPVAGNHYEVERQGESLTVQKLGGVLDEAEDAQVQLQVADAMGPNLMSPLLGKRKMKIGDQVELPFAVMLTLLREADRSKFPKLQGSITLKKVDGSGAERIAIFDVVLGLNIKEADGTVLKTDMTGALGVRVDTLWLTSLALRGPLDVESPDSQTTFEQGTISYDYQFSYSP